MSDDEPVNEPPKKKGGWPRGKPRLRRTPLEAKTDVKRPSGARWEMKAGANWESNDIQHTEGIDRLHIPRGDIPEGMDLQWVVDSVMGQPQPQHRGQFERKGWTPVHQEDFDHAFDGMFMPKGAQGEIMNEGLVLMARPKEFTDKAKKLEGFVDRAFERGLTAKHVEENLALGRPPHWIETQA